MRLNYFLDKTSQQPLYLQLYQQIKQAIHQQQLNSGDKLPSKRRLCEFLKISQNTVESAYSQLLAEGYIESSARRGFFVCFQAETQLLATPIRPIIQDEIKPSEILYDFNPNKIDQTNFPLKEWKKSGRISENFLLSAGDSQGEKELRQQIALYLAESRGVNCQPEQIIITAGVEVCLQQLILLFNQLDKNNEFIYAMENYGYEKAEKLLELYQKKIVKMPIDFETNELDLSLFENQKMNIAYITPSNLYPFGQVLSINQRQKILEWVNQSEDHYIIEDDYDSEFRYKGKPIPSLQSLDFNQKVIYLGSFSKLLSPALRISFMILPQKLLDLYHQYCNFFNSTVPRFEQIRLAHFMQQGHFERHINRMRKIYRKKMDYICELLSPYTDHIQYYGEHSGFYILIEILNLSADISQRLLENGVKTYPIDLNQRHLLVLGFGHLNESEIQQGMTALFDVIENNKMAQS